MAYIRTKSNYIQKVRLEIGKVMGEQEDSEVFLVLREPTSKMMLEMSELSTENERDMIEYFGKILPEIIVNHNFYEDEAQTQKMSNADIAALIMDTVGAVSTVMEQYYQAAFFTRQQKTAE